MYTNCLETELTMCLYGVTRLTGAGHTLKVPNGFLMAVSPVKREKSGTPMDVADDQKRFAHVACQCDLDEKSRVRGRVLVV